MGWGRGGGGWGSVAAHPAPSLEPGGQLVRVGGVGGGGGVLARRMVAAAHQHLGGVRLGGGRLGGMRLGGVTLGEVRLPDSLGRGLGRAGLVRVGVGVGVGAGLMSLVRTSAMSGSPSMPSCGGGMHLVVGGGGGRVGVRVRVEVRVRIERRARARGWARGWG